MEGFDKLDGKNGWMEWWLLGGLVDMTSHCFAP
jgi:hypothetical protein